MTTKQGLSPNEIRAELIRRGIKVKDIAQKAGVTPEAVSMVIASNTAYKGHKVRPYIANAIEKSVKEIWPN